MRRDRQAILLVLPSIALLSLFLLYPFLTAFSGAFYDWEEGKYKIFCGLANFRTVLFEDFFFWPAMRNMAILTVGAVLPTVMITLAVPVAPCGSRTVSVAVYRPLAVYVCDGFASVD